MNRIGNLPVDLYSTICHDNTYIYSVVACTLNSRLLSGHLGVIAGTLRGFIFPVRYGSVSVQLTRLRKLNQGTLTSECVTKNRNAAVLQVTCTMQQSSRGGKRVHKTVPGTAVVVLTFVFEHTHFIPRVGVGKGRCTIIIGPW